MAAVCLADTCVSHHDPHLTSRPTPEGVLPPPRMPRCATGSSRRPFCRIFPEGRIWVLELRPEFSLAADARVPPKRLVFPTLGAALFHAIANDYRYKVIHAQPKPAPVMPFVKLAKERADKCRESLA
jgi:hypothetical protein